MNTEAELTTVKKSTARKLVKYLRIAGIDASDISTETGADVGIYIEPDLSASPEF